jgi:DNA polymerase V
MEKVQGIKIYSAELSDESFELEYIGKVPAGFASPAADYLAESIDINKLIIKNKEYTFIGKVEGTSMIDASLNDGDLIVIDRSLDPRDNDKVLVCVDGEFTIKFVSVDAATKKVWLVPANAAFPRVEVTEGSDVRIWGVVTYSITKHRG